MMKETHSELDKYLEEFCHDTTTKHDNGGLKVRRSFVAPYEEALLSKWRFWAFNCEKNGNYFTKRDLQYFVDKYVETLFARTTHPLYTEEPYCVKSGTIVGGKELVQPFWFYEALSGMYYHDVRILFYMASELANHGLKLQSIEKAINNLCFQVDPGEPKFDFTKPQKLQYMPIYQQKELFLKYRELTKQIIASPTPETVSMLRKKEHAKLTRRKHKLQRFAQKYCPFPTLAEGIEKAYQRRKKEKEYIERYKQKFLEKEQEKNL